jgi:transcriptional regulator with XRE-family HTH domain
MAATMTSLYAADYNVWPEEPGSALSSATRAGGLRGTFAYHVAGTLGVLTPEAVEAGYATSVVPVHYELHEAQEEAAQALALERTAAENLARIRKVLGPTVLELANLFGVSRQAVYDWQAGAQPAPQAAERLGQLARAADVFDEAKVAVDAKALRRRVAGGGTLLDAVLRGGNAEGVARSLVGTLRREAAQRARLQAQLAGRNPAPVDPRDYGAPAVSDDV